MIRSAMGRPGVPEEVTFATKPELTRRMLEKARGAGVSASWMVEDSIYHDTTDC
jgi:SRSO17 transposase